MTAEQFREMRKLRKQVVAIHSEALKMVDLWSLKDGFSHSSVDEAIDRMEDAIDRLNEITEEDWL